ncbi:K(lysine) acetyltransferase [Coemansia spiralis]|uniref:histone acetyltransferase n=2 Tax=Coemansia TaxID=4863 RepID=A0A9W8G7N2_9FUNG|nr:K(lysine) acetyltransferase [Coemansia umbellata]KAJ2621975.1 K(lysine) acetyltransferase [Coemansia sp. RSA 1358]KAJ2680442.1 K(lysine) acetyltransferase [Coemansia spiralis]
MGKPPPKKKHAPSKGNGKSRATRCQRRREAEEASLKALSKTPVAAASPSPSVEKEQVLENGEIRRIVLGDYSIAAWYASPYPAEFKQSQELYICERCLKYMQYHQTLALHSCTGPFPRGRLVYEDAAAALFEVDGKEHTLYCQNLCLLSKLFLDQKTIFYDIGGFLFYILLVRRQQNTSYQSMSRHGGSRANQQKYTEVAGHYQTDFSDFTFAGYFSKEKTSIERNNLACILVLPPFRGQNYGQLLIELSYELTKQERTTGGPEQPLSSQGFHSYRSYWRRAVILALLGESLPPEQCPVRHFSSMHHHDQKPEKNQRIFSLSRLTLLTGIRTDDVLFTLEDLGLLKLWLGRHILCIADETIRKVIAERRINLAMRMDPSGLMTDSDDDKLSESASSANDNSDGNNADDGSGEEDSD